LAARAERAARERVEDECVKTWPAPVSARDASTSDEPAAPEEDAMNTATEQDTFSGEDAGSGVELKQHLLRLDNAGEGAQQSNPEPGEVEPAQHEEK
jgi:hypothetical protein